MKYIYFLVTFLLIQSVIAEVVTVTDVKVSVTADSPAAAREQALDRAHSLAFQKLLIENFPEKSGVLPSQDDLINMVEDFSIDREKTTPRSYTASLTFQFDKSQLQAWLQQGQPSSSRSSVSQQPYTEGKLFKMTATYTTLSQWQQIKKAVESSPEVQKMTVFSFSPQNAYMEVVYSGDMVKLQQHLLRQELTLSSQGDVWVISSNTHRLP